MQKAYEGSATSLARYGIIIKPVTTDVDALKEKWAQLRDEGVQFTAQQTEQQAVQLKVAERAVDAYSRVATDATTTLIVPSHMGELASLIGSAMALVKQNKV